MFKIRLLFQEKNQVAIRSPLPYKNNNKNILEKWISFSMVNDFSSLDTQVIQRTNSIGL